MDPIAGRSIMTGSFSRVVRSIPGVDSRGESSCGPLHNATLLLDTDALARDDFSPSSPLAWIRSLDRLPTVGRQLPSHTQTHPDCGDERLSISL